MSNHLLTTPPATAGYRRGVWDGQPDPARQRDALRRIADLALAGGAPGDGELAFFTAIGSRHGESGTPPSALRRSLDAVVRALLRELDAACGPGGGDLLDAVRWLGTHGTALREACWRGYFSGLDRSYSRTGRVQRLARLLLDGDSAAGGLADGLGLRLPVRWLVVVVRVVDAPGAGAQNAIVEELSGEWRAPMLWREPTEFAVLADGAAPDGGGPAALALVRRLAAVTGRPCAAGAAESPAGGLAAAASQARQISLVARPAVSPDRLYRLADVFVELAAARLPDLGEWLNGLAARLAGGPDLLITLDHYYRHDMSRLRTARSLAIHPRTLDYRLARVRELTGLDPGSVRGIRVLETIAARMSSGAWTLPRQNVS